MPAVRQWRRKLAAYPWSKAARGKCKASRRPERQRREPRIAKQWRLHGIAAPRHRIHPAESEPRPDNSGLARRRPHLAALRAAREPTTASRRPRENSRASLLSRPQDIVAVRG